MNVAQQVHQLLTKTRRYGLQRVALGIFRQIRDRIYPPWFKLYWVPVREVPEPGSNRNIPPGYEAFHKFVARLIQGVKLQNVKSLDDLAPHELQSLTECVGVSALPIFRQRLLQGVELHILFVEGRVVGTVFFVLGKNHAFQHMVLTDRDAMGLDGRIDQAFRGRGLYPVVTERTQKPYCSWEIERFMTTLI